MTYDMVQGVDELVSGLGDMGDLGAYGDVARELLAGDDALVSGDDDDIGALVKRAKKRGMSVAQLSNAIRNQQRGFQLLAADPSGPGAFNMSGSLCLLSFSGTVTAAGSLTIQLTLDRQSTIREVRCDKITADLRVTAFTAGALPFAALQFPFSLASFGPLSNDRKVRALSFPANTRFSITLNNPNGADIPALVECWGSAG